VVEKAIARLCPAVRYLTVPTGGSNKGLLALTGCAALEELILLSKDGVAPRLAKVIHAPPPPRRQAAAHLCHICTRAGPIPATSAPGLGSPPPHLHSDWAQAGSGDVPGAGRCTARRLAP
jgi:hypothetical protein